MAVKNDLARANPNTLADFFRRMNLGSYMRSQAPQMVSMKTPALDASQLATLFSFNLADDAKASVVLRAVARTGTTKGEYAAQAYGATPTSGQIAVAPNGDIVVLGTDAPVGMDVVYLPERGDLITLTGLKVTTGVATIPSTIAARGVVYLVFANATKGTVTGQKIVLVPTDSLPATTKAALNIAKTEVHFNNATDAVTECTVKLLVRPLAAQDLDTILESADDMM